MAGDDFDVDVDAAELARAREIIPEPHAHGAAIGTDANKLFCANMFASWAESMVCIRLRQILGDGGWEDFTADYYDGSIEVYGVGDHALTEGQQTAFREMGFSRMWTHKDTKDGGRDKAGERYYQLAEPTPAPERGKEGMRSLAEPKEDERG